MAQQPDPEREKKGLAVSVKPPCPDCGHVHTAADIYAVGRFNPGGTIGYRARYPGAPLRASRDEAAKDLCTWRQK